MTRIDSETEAVYAFDTWQSDAVNQMKKDLKSFREDCFYDIVTLIKTKPVVGRISVETARELLQLKQVVDEVCQSLNAEEIMEGMNPN